MKPFSPLELADHFEQIPRLRIPSGSSMRMKLFAGSNRKTAQLLEADGGVGVVAQDGFASIGITTEETLAMSRSCVFCVPPPAESQPCLRLAE